jgi:hypothetical protein
LADVILVPERDREWTLLMPKAEGIPMLHLPDPVAEIQGQRALPLLRKIDCRFIAIDLELDEAIDATVETLDEIETITSHRFLPNLQAHAPATMT